MAKSARWLAVPVFSIIGTLAGLPASGLTAPIDGDRLVIERSNGREQLAFSTRDPSWTLPPWHPSDNGPGPVRVELFSSAEPFGATLNIPELASPSVWRVMGNADGTIRGFRLRNPDAPNAAGDFSAALLRDNGTLRLIARRSGLTLAAPQEYVGIRITFPDGGGVLCALFHDGNVAVDRPGKFVGKRAVATDIPDCQTETLGGMRPCGADPGVYECKGVCPEGETCVVADPFTPTCHCVGPASPCGDTAPMCNGTCPDGTTCMVTSSGTFGPNCGCLAPGECGDYSTYSTCGGTCAAGTSCYAYFSQAGQFLTQGGCLCATTDLPCSCSGGYACPAGQLCHIAAVPNLCFAQCE
jgi:hypothetical protein